MRRSGRRLHHMRFTQNRVREPVVALSLRPSEHCAGAILRPNYRQDNNNVTHILINQPPSFTYLTSNDIQKNTHDCSNTRFHEYIMTSLNKISFIGFLSYESSFVNREIGAETIASCVRYESCSVVNYTV